MGLSPRKNTPRYNTSTQKSRSLVAAFLVKKKPQAVESAHGLGSID
jgi:hypothetical protein